jgi:glutathione S-transferase
VQKIVSDRLRGDGDRDPAGVEDAGGTLDRAYALLDGRRGGTKWARADDFSIADCAAAPALFYGRVVHSWDEGRLENLTRYYRSLMDRPSVRRVVDEARPYRDLFPLPWPDDADAHPPSNERAE